MDKITEGQKLKMLIDKNGFSVYGFAKEMEVDVQKVQNWIKRNSIPKRHLVKVADKFGVTTDYFLR